MFRVRDLMEGQGLTEYAFILTLVALVVLFALVLVGPQIGAVFSQVVNYNPMAVAEASSPDPEPPGPEPEEPSGPPDCYGSALMPLMVGLMGAGLLATHGWSKLRRRPLSFGLA